jgi:type III secretion system low calcium response chaperone LcrH/SycD
MSKAEVSFKTLSEDIAIIAKQAGDLLLEKHPELNEQTTKNTENQAERVQRGLEEIVACLENQPTWLTTWQNKELMQELANAANKHIWIEKKGEDDNLEEKSLGETLGISQDSLDTIYAIAYHLYQDKEFEKASDVFRILCIFEPLMHIGWFGLALSEHEQERWQAALEAYTMASITDSETPLPHFHSAECYEAMNDIPKTLEALDLAIEIVDQTRDKQFQSIKELAIQKK